MSLFGLDRDPTKAVRLNSVPRPMAWWRRTLVRIGFWFIRRGMRR